MATHKSAEKRHRQNETKQTQNRWWKSRIRTVSRQVVEAATKKDKKAASAALVLAMKEIGKAKSKKVIHPNNASRKVARLSKLVSAL